MVGQTFLLALLFCSLGVEVLNDKQAKANTTAPPVGGCPDHRCQRGGICHSIGTYKRCICRAGRAGRYCEKTATLCNNDYICLNGGTCVIFDKKKSCICPLNYKGQFCEMSISVGVCNNNTCGRGQCVQHKENVFGCKCEPGFEGMTCDTGINECQSSPCQNGAECRDLENDYACKCMDGFRGRNCELLACKTGLCVFGTCRNTVDGYACDCMPGYKGERCLQQMEGCADTPCKNEGTCHTIQGGYRCACVFGYTGRHCDIASQTEIAVKVGTKGETLPLDSVGGILILSFGCLVIVGAIIRRTEWKLNMCLRRRLSVIRCSVRRLRQRSVIQRRKFEKEESSLSTSKEGKDKDGAAFVSDKPRKDSDLEKKEKSRKSGQERGSLSGGFSFGKMFGRRSTSQDDSSRRSSASENSVKKEQPSEQTSGGSSRTSRNYSQLLRSWLRDLRRKSAAETPVSPARKSDANVSLEQDSQASSGRKSASAPVKG